MQGLVDTHCHLQAPAFEADLAEVVARARAAGVADMVVCAGDSDDWERTACVAREHGLAYMLGIHPLLVPKAHEEDLERLSALAEASMADPHFIGIGEIGLEGLVMTIDARQEHFFREQLRIAARLDLPCAIPVRKRGEGRNSFRANQSAGTHFAGVKNVSVISDRCYGPAPSAENPGQYRVPQPDACNGSGRGKHLWHVTIFGSP